MNWYELATASEVVEALSKVYRDNWDSETEWIQPLFEAARNEYINQVDFAIAEQLWAEEEFNGPTYN